MKVYHYTKPDAWFYIKESGKLEPQRVLGVAHEKAYNCAAIFCLLESQPANWIENKYFTDIWNRLKRDIGHILLEVSLPNDNVYIIDRGHIQGFLDGNETHIPKEFLHPDRATAERFYAESKVPIDKYSGEYLLPEVIICDPIDLQNIRVSDIQPLLEKDYASSTTPYLKTFFMRQIRNIHELQPWIAKQSSVFQQELEKITKKYKRSYALT